MYTVGARFRVTCNIAARNAIKVNASPRNSTEFVCSSTSTSSLPNLWNLDSANIFYHIFDGQCLICFLLSCAGLYLQTHFIKLQVLLQQCRMHPCHSKCMYTKEMIAQQSQVKKQPS